MAYPLAPPLADEIKSDESIPHLRAAAGFFAAVQADELLHQFYAESKNKIKQMKKISIIEKPNHKDKACAHLPTRRHILPPTRADASELHLI